MPENANKKTELLAPGGDLLSIKAAILAGADAVYCGIEKFNARNRASNISFDELGGILQLAHKYDCKVFLTLNILILETEIPDLIRVLNRLCNTGIDAVIVHDPGLFYILLKFYPDLVVHASTQTTTHNTGQLKFLKRLMVSRVNLSRELNMDEIRELTTSAGKLNLETEVFVHGSYCISFSGLCYMSSVENGNSGNRGKCSQQCRDQYLRTEAGVDFPLNLKDNSAFFDLIELADTGVDSIKIEGRIKEFDYVFSVVDAWRKQIDLFCSGSELMTTRDDLHRVFNRGFTNGYLKNEIGRDMFIDNPGSNSASYYIDNLEGENGLFQSKLIRKNELREMITDLSAKRIPVKVIVKGEFGYPLQIKIITPDINFEVQSGSNFHNHGTEPMTGKIVLKNLNVLDDLGFTIKEFDDASLATGLFINFKELNELKKKVFSNLSGGKEYKIPVILPSIQNIIYPDVNPELHVLISRRQDIEGIDGRYARIYFQLPDNISGSYEELTRIFKSNQNLIPWFPPILIGDDYKAAIRFMGEVKPSLIVSNNSGIGFYAWNNNLAWIAGPSMNLTNSYSLKCLKDYFNCSGAFISNELNHFQIKSIKSPGNFELYFSIDHPNELMISRQCLFQQVTGCEKKIMDGTCLSDCEKTAEIRKPDNTVYHLIKQKGSYHRIIHQDRYINSELLTDLPRKFKGYLIDRRNIGIPNLIEPRTNRQYKDGIR